MRVRVKCPTERCGKLLLVTYQKAKQHRLIHCSVCCISCNPTHVGADGVYMAESTNHARANNWTPTHVVQVNNKKPQFFRIH
jgi:hypothetical protein